MTKANGAAASKSALGSCTDARLAVVAVLAAPTVAALLLASCVGMAQVGSLSEIGPDEVVTVAKIQLDPPLQNNEQQLKFTMEGYRNRVVFVVDERVRDPEKIGLGDISVMQKADLGQLFYAKARRAPALFYSAPMILLDEMDKMILPGGLEVAIPPAARMVYFGTLIYKRDAYSAITGVELKDELEAARQEVSARFGSNAVLTPTTVRPPQAPR